MRSSPAALGAFVQRVNNLLQGQASSALAVSLFLAHFRELFTLPYFLLSFMLDACLQHCNIMSVPFSGGFFTWVPKKWSKILHWERELYVNQGAALWVWFLVEGSVFPQPLAAWLWGKGLLFCILEAFYITLSSCYTLSGLKAFTPENKLWYCVPFYC
jgi:hypothetical protein